MQWRSNFSADPRDTDNHRKVENKKESDCPKSHSHLKTEEKKKQ